MNGEKLTLTLHLTLFVLPIEIHLSPHGLIDLSKTMQDSGAQQDAIIVSFNMHILTLFCPPPLSHTHTETGK